MRVLLLHNRYRAPGGEERAVGDLQALLERKGDTVELIERSSAEAGRRRAATGLLAGGLEPAAVAAAVRRTRAEVVHAHNLHPLFGWRALAAAREAGARTVLHLHNFRLFCAIGIAYRDGAPCFRCQRRNTLPGLRLRCRGSLGEAVLYATALRQQQPRLLANADRVLVVSEATRRRLVQLGLPDGQAMALPNFVPAERFAQRSKADRGRHVLVVGRLVEEKGFDTAIAAARAAQVPLVVAGEGPDLRRLKQLAGDGEVRFVGRLDAPALSQVLAGAAAVLAPSRWEEPCPYAVLDALAAGVPVLVSDIGGLPEVAGEQCTLPAEDRHAWTETLAQLWRDPDARRERGEQALERARELFGEDRYYERLMQVYGG